MNGYEPQQQLADVLTHLGRAEHLLKSLPLAPLKNGLDRHRLGRARGHIRAAIKALK